MIRIKKDAVLSLLNEGKNYGEIASIIGVTRNSMGRFCRKNFGLLEDRGKSQRQSIELTEKQQEILFGGLLGDICIQKHCKNYRGNIVHSIKQLEYAQYLYKELNNIVGIFRFIKVKANNNIYNECQFSIRPNLNLKSFYENFYGDFNGKKDIPYNLKLLTPLAIAVWFMDDGFLIDNGHSKTLGFSTCNFTLDGLQRIKKYLEETYSIKTIIRKNSYLIVKRESALTLKNLIIPYIIDSMKYKVNLD